MDDLVLHLGKLFIQMLDFNVQAFIFPVVIAQVLSYDAVKPMNLHPQSCEFLDIPTDVLYLISSQSFDLLFLLLQLLQHLLVM